MTMLLLLAGNWSHPNLKPQIHNSRVFCCEDAAIIILDPSFLQNPKGHKYVIIFIEN